MPDPKPPLRRVVEIKTYNKWTPTAGSFSVDVEVLECGHERTPKENAHFGGTDIGDRKRRRCAECSLPPIYPSLPACPDCGGHGEMSKTPCEGCQGRGSIPPTTLHNTRFDGQLCTNKRLQRREAVNAAPENTETEPQQGANLRATT